ncbi:MAG TPA: nickel pincer cofactor biosynthesis protein LarC [Nitrosopumilaceae archaeon]|nr:nickel pincer cofactor biosynthesis protein LarC [Nitrosopumilaceae archaeon]
MVLIIDPQVAGISGDMLLSALISMGANKSKIIDGIHTSENYLSGSKIQKIDFDKIVNHGIEAMQLLLDVKENTHERKGTDIQECILLTSDKIDLSEQAKVFAKESIRSLIKAESKIHGEPMESVHFHEASSIDTVVDIIGTAIALDDLNFFSEEIISMPVAVGGGTLTFSHGTISNPASAILEIFRNSDIIISGAQIKEELTTPTGASLLVNLADSCLEFYPAIRVKSIGYGAGKKVFDGFPNVLKIVKADKTEQFQQDSVQILETNLDDISGEVLGHMIDKIIANGAKDVTVAPAITKKGRPTNLVSVICDSSSVNTVLDTLISETGTLGIRIRSSARFVVPRVIISVPVIILGKSFTVRCKMVKNQELVQHFKVEASDVKSIADSLSISFKDANEFIRTEIKQKLSLK